MSEPPARDAAGSRRRVLVAAALAALLPALQQLFLGHRHLNLSDEGFFWHGVQLTLRGELPIRDFYAYDPLRYLWCAAWGLLRGDGVVATREAGALFQVLGLLCALLVAARLVPRTWHLLPVGIALCLWTFPRYKVWEPASLSLSIWACVCLLERRDGRAHLVAGLVCGFVGFVGRNDGLYTALGMLAAIGLCAWKAPAPGLARRLGAWAGGVVLGYAPMLALVAFAPGYLGAFADSLAFYVTYGTNQPIPYPWPWRFGYEPLRADERVGLALTFLLPVVVYPAAAWTLLRARAADLAPRAALLGAALVGAFWAHHAAVRSDTVHLSMTIPALFLATLGLAARRGVPGTASRVAVGLLFVLTMIVAPATNPVLDELRVGFPPTNTAELSDGDDVLEVDETTASYVDGMRRLLDRFVPPPRPLLIVPGFTSLYPLTGREDPLGRMYFLWELDDDDQREMIAELRERGVDHVLVIDSVPSRDLLFERLCPLVWEHLNAEFQRHAQRALPPAHTLFVRKR